MGKIKLKLSTGVEQEKEVISAFKIGSESYVVFDNETTGSMGLPIILVSKIVGDKVVKIVEQNEWQTTKESLKLIIANSAVDYIVVPSVLNSDEVYATQLTLPEASFIAIRNNYKPVPDSGANGGFIPNAEIQQSPIVTPAPTVTPVVPQVSSDANIVTPVMPVVQTPVAPTMQQIPVTQVPVTPVTTTEVVTPPQVVEPVMQPQINITPVSTPVVQQIIPEIIPTVPVVEKIVPVMPSAPVVNMQVEQSEEIPVKTINYNDLKETFIKSCENMFDALVKQIENK